MCKAIYSKYFTKAPISSPPSLFFVPRSTLPPDLTPFWGCLYQSAIWRYVCTTMRWKTSFSSLFFCNDHSNELLGGFGWVSLCSANPDLRSRDTCNWCVRYPKRFSICVILAVNCVCVCVCVCVRERESECVYVCVREREGDSGVLKWPLNKDIHHV